MINRLTFITIVAWVRPFSCVRSMMGRETRWTCENLLHIEQGNNPFLPVAVWKVSAGFSFSVLIGVPTSGSRMTSFMSPVSGFRTRVGLMNCFIGRPASWSRMCRFLELGSRNLLLHTGHSWGCSPVKNNKDLKVAFYTFAFRET